jgi:hypothetical protein
MSFNDKDIVSDEVDLYEIIKKIWHAKLLIFVFTVFSGLFSIYYALSLPEIYRSEATLMPANNISTPSNSNSGVIGSLAGLTGLYSTPQVTKLEEAIQVIRSFNFFEELIGSSIQIQDILAVKDWDPISNTLIYDELIFDQESLIWLREVEFPREPTPSSSEAFEAFSQIINIENTGGFINLSIDHQSPYIAKNWVEEIINKINQRFIMNDKLDSENALSFLNDQINRTNLVELRQGIADLIQQQTRTLMLVEANPDYIFKVIEPPRVPERRISPARTIIVIGITGIGFILSIIIALLFDSWAQQSRKKIN